MTDHLRKKYFQIICRFGKFCGFLGDAFRNSEDRTFFRFHDSLISRRSCAVACFGKNDRIDFFILPDFLCKSTEKLRKDNPRISSGASQ